MMYETDVEVEIDDEEMIEYLENQGYVISPEGKVGYNTLTKDDIQFLMDLVDATLELRSNDKSRIYDALKEMWRNKKY